MIDDRESLAATFDRAAELYDEVRPGYPDALFDHLVEVSCVPERGRVLEIGCGTGQATRPLTERGYGVVALEPGANLAALARRNLSPFPNVEVRQETFEEWEVEPATFDLIVAATSFKWVDPAVRYRKCCAALRPGGSAALFWNAHIYVPGEDHFFDEVQAIYTRYLPETVGRPPLRSELPTTIELGFIETGLFDQAAVRQYPWTERYETERYVKLLQTYSEHISLPEEERARLLFEIAELIEGEFGGRVVKHHVAVLQVARRIEG